MNLHGIISYVLHCAYTVELACNALSFCDNSAITWYQLIPHKASFFLPFLVQHTQEHYLGYSDIASHQFHYNFPRIDYFENYMTFSSLRKQAFCSFR